MPRDDRAIQVPASAAMFRWIREQAAAKNIAPGLMVYQVLQDAMSASRPEPVAPPASDE